MTVNLEYYRVFYYVAKYLNMTHAANELYLTQPSVSRTIQNLENQLGCLLFTRGTRGVELTPEGDMLYQQIQPAFAAILAAEEEVEKLKSFDAGILRISANETAMKTVLMPVLKNFREQHPHVTIEICRYTPTDILFALSNCALDLVLDFDTITKEDLSEVDGVSFSSEMPNWRNIGIKKQVLRTFDDEAIVGSELAYLSKRNVQIDELINYPLIIPKIDNYSKLYYQKLFRQNGLLRPLDMEITGAPMRILLTKHNLGISFIPVECVEEEIQCGYLFPLHLSGKLLERRLILMTNESSNLSLAATKFIEILLENENIDPVEI